MSAIAMYSQAPHTGADCLTDQVHQLRGIPKIYIGIHVTPLCLGGQAVELCCALRIQCAEAMEQVDGDGEESDGGGLVQQGDDDVDVGEHGENAKDDL